MRSYVKVLIFTAFILFLIFCAHTEAQLSDDEETTTEQTEEEWHMDFMPTGYLPDSVYRELAWYGILQIQPLHHSSKHKVAAQLIWQHTLGRPHVIMESTPQSTQSPGKVSRQILAEEAAKWSREQRAAQEVLMENIKSGGNGITVRTVISNRNKTIYIIQNGNYFMCPQGTEPDLDAYRVQANMHERKCTYGKPSIQIPVDPCIEAETAPIEYSFHEGWMFCLGNGDRESNYFENGTLDCGNKTKVSVDDFLDLCAIDNNVVITFDYFGDEPRKDMMHNVTLCTTWDPCRLSYLYRLEPPPVEMTPSFPTTPENPCETTVCPECREGATEDMGQLIDLESDSENAGINTLTGEANPENAGSGGDGTGHVGSGSDGAEHVGSGSDGAGNAGSGSEGAEIVGSGGDGAGQSGSGGEGAGNAVSGSEGAGNAVSGSEGAGNAVSGSEGAENVGSGGDGTGNAGSGSDGGGNAGSGSDGGGNAGSGSDGGGNAGSGGDDTGNAGSGGDGTGNAGSGNESPGSSEAQGGRKHARKPAINHAKKPAINHARKSAINHASKPAIKHTRKTAKKH